MQRRTYVYSGHVQGVGFRYTVIQAAEQYAVTGYVRNLPDGRVECVMEGSDDEMDRLAQEIADRMQGFIRHVQVNASPATGEFDAFAVRH